MATELHHEFTTTKPIDESFAAITDLDRLIPCVDGGRVVESTGPDSAKAEILMKMGAMSMKMVGTVEVAEQDPEAHRAVLRVKAREATLTKDDFLACLRFAFDEAYEQRVILRPVELVVKEAIGLPRLEARNAIDGYRWLVDQGVLCTIGPLITDNSIALAPVIDACGVRPSPGPTARAADP